MVYVSKNACLLLTKYRMYCYLVISCILEILLEGHFFYAKDTKFAIQLQISQAHFNDYITQYQ